jgi:hypothetical protein
VTRRKIRDYDGPRAGYIAAGDRVFSITDPEGILALTDAGLLLSLGPTAKAKKYKRLTDARETRVPA